MSHVKDADCTVIEGTCIGCGVDHSGHCPACLGKGFHVAGCVGCEPELYFPGDGETRTTCQAHLTSEFYLAGTLPNGDPVMACPECGAVAAWHESPAETAARIAACSTKRVYT